ncbi:MAG: ion channel [Tateyamaria sp.]|uniref:ion channel n=1 Tax=Tateyamaria sp. TaxID=1929288 RepID=UPI00328E062E
MAFDLITVAYVMATLPLEVTPFLRAINLAIALVILFDFGARLWISGERLHYFFRVYVMSDVLVLISLLFNPYLAFDLTFLRILRGLRLAHSEYLLNDLRRDFSAFRDNEYVFVAGVNLAVFLGVTIAAVYSFFPAIGRGTDGFVNAIYFTVTTLTTTGYGDILPKSNAAKLSSVVIMVVGVTLFVNLARAMFRPRKVQYECRTCGLQLHDPDAVHCKHCGESVRIKTSGIT